MQRTARAYDVNFKDGVPVLPEGTRLQLMEKGFDEFQIKVAVDRLSSEMIKKGLRKSDIIMVPFSKVL